VKNIEDVNEILRNMKRRNLTYPSTFISKSDEEDYFAPDPLQNILNMAKHRPYPPGSIFDSRKEEQDYSSLIKPVRLPQIPPLFTSNSRNADPTKAQPWYSKFQAEQSVASVIRQTRIEQQKQRESQTYQDSITWGMSHAWMECDIKKGMSRGDACVAHPLARLELLKMGYRS